MHTEFCVQERTRKTIFIVYHLETQKKPFQGGSLGIASFGVSLLLKYELALNYLSN